MVSVVTNEEEYKSITLFLLGKDAEILLSKDSKYRLKKKSLHFMLFTDLLYLKDDEELHKRVLHGNDVELIKLEATKLHNVQHFRANRFENVCNKFFFKIPKNIINEFVSNCTTCRQAQPLKIKKHRFTF
ncbi:hypothetical protein CDIK_3549 [Cucumispora dikerogammari]|nr:hypothetical protein CDIK_3549 [Cucumispora dikerogammari]